MFTDAKIGDRVYSMDFGWSRVVSRVDKLGIPTPIQLRSECENRRVFWMSTCGRLHSFSKHPTVFWHSPMQIPEVWVVIMPKLGWDCIVGVYSCTYPLERLKKAFPSADYEFERRVIEMTADEHIAV